MDSEPEDLSPRPHHLLSGIVFAKDRHLIWLSKGKTAYALHGLLLRYSLRAMQCAKSTHIISFLPLKSLVSVRYFYHIITHVETELQAVVGSSCEC